MSCKTCGGKTEGYKCDVCGAEANIHDSDHPCGGEHCMPKCAACGKVETMCKCK